MFFITDAYAQGAPGGEPSWTLPVVMMVALGFMYFMMIRPQAKRANKNSQALVFKMIQCANILTR